jgi:hypothetical protein
MPRASRRSLAFGALLLLLSLGAAVAQESFVHTDDGCQVEVHCLACRLAIATAGTVASLLGARVELARADRVPAATATLCHQADVRREVSRGPPLAS